MRLKHRFFASGLVLAGMITGCSETSPQETTASTGKTEAPSTPGRPAVGDAASWPQPVINLNPDAGNPSIPSNAVRPEKVAARAVASVADLTPQQLEAEIAKLSVYEGGDTSTPELGLHHFLQALKRRDAVATEQLLTSVARIEAQQSGSNISLAEQPPFSKRAQFKFGKLEFVDATKTGARIPVLTTDIEEQGEYTEEIIWVLGRDDHGWRVAGYAFELFENEPWLVLNFEDLEEVRRKQHSAEAAMRRRAEEQALEARRRQNPTGNPSFQPQR